MDDPKPDLRAYYEAEVETRVRPLLSSRRAALADEFARFLSGEGRSSIVDFGSGPGRDGERFASAGLSYLGVDLAFGNAVLAKELGVTVLQADLLAPPFRRHSFEGGWSMSTLMHFREQDVRQAVVELAGLLRPGSPMLIGMWGGEGGDVVSEMGVPGHRRYFGLRSQEQNAALLASRSNEIEWSAVWEFGESEWEYHLFRLRACNQFGLTDEFSGR